LRNLLVAQGVEEIALVFIAVDAAQQAAFAVNVLAAHVVACGDKIGPQIFGGEFQEGFEFDFFIAQDVRVRRTAGLVLFQEQFKDVVPVLCREVHRVQFDAEFVAYRLCIGQIGRCEQYLHHRLLPSSS
jgi:monoamine oxidase